MSAADVPASPGTPPELSVVVAGVNVGRTLRPWLEAIERQIRGRDVEVLVAIAGRDAPAVTIEPGRIAQLMIVPDAATVPVLWGAALARARGRIVAVTTTPCMPAGDWLDAIGAARQGSYAGIGGTIDLAPDATLVDRAVHLVRYSSYLPPMAPGPIDEIAADNASYLRVDLEPSLPSIERDGFWEAEFHRELRARNRQLWFDPRVRVTHARSYTFAAFSRQRFVHGRRFGRMRRQADSAFVRIARIPAVVVVPAVMLTRIVRHLTTRRRLDGSMIAAMPLVLWFLFSWAAGEAVGQFDE